MLHTVRRGARQLSEAPNKYSPEWMWIYPRKWPNAPRGFQFLIPAIERVGANMFGSDWKYDGFLLEERSLPADLLEARPEDRAHAHSILQQLHGDAYQPDYEDNGWTPIGQPEYGSLAALGSLGAPPRRIQLGEPSNRADGYWFTAAQWDEVQAYLHYLKQTHRPRIEMAMSVARWLSDEIVDGKIRTFLFRLDGRDPREGLSKDWYCLDIDRRRRRIRNCRMKPEDPASDSGSHFIFIHEADLAAALDGGDRSEEKTTSETVGVFADNFSAEATDDSDQSDHGAPALGEGTALQLPEVIISTGSAGRPSSMHIVLSEIERRIAAGETAPESKTALAKEMTKWLRDTHGARVPKLGFKGMTNNGEFSAAHRNWKGSKSEA